VNAGAESLPDPAPSPRQQSGGWNAQRITAVIIGVIVLGLVGVLAFSDTAVEREGASPLLGRNAPLFSGESVLADGQRFSLADQQGKWVVLNVFAPWCVPCVREHPMLVDFAEDNSGAESDVVLVSAIFDSPRGDVRDFFAERGGTWPVLSDSKLLVDYGITGVPETFLISPAGQVLWKWSAELTRTRLDEALTRGRSLYNSARDAGSTTAAATTGTP
jgi:cytochrome c biogenesis protein CcmG, thiol:disulfide interchange protein DsbE